MAMDRSTAMDRAYAHVTEALVILSRPEIEQDAEVLTIHQLLEEALGHIAADNKE